MSSQIGGSLSSSLGNARAGKILKVERESFWESIFELQYFNYTNMFTERCAITGYPLKPGELMDFHPSIYEYSTQYVGRVKITDIAFTDLLNLKLNDERRFIIAGLCKERTLNNEEPLLIDSAFVHGTYKNQNFPVDFEEKSYHFLKYMYTHGGKENHEFLLKSGESFSLAFASQEEFKRILEYLESEAQISIESKRRLAGPQEPYWYMGVRITSKGKLEAQKSLPKMPMIGLVNQEITTGDVEIDKTINHAKRLFFEQPQSMDNMRSACESLSYVLEPLRSQCERIFGNPDTNAFFSIVNNFDIRHNKRSTKEIEFPEQLEWVFYSLLNTINTYTKLKTKNI